MTKKDKLMIKLGSSCLKKRRYQTEQKAQEIINKIHNEGRKTKLRVYFCKFCLGYHLTSKELNCKKEVCKGDAILL